MLKVLREWWFSVGLLALWGTAAAYSLHALVGLETMQLPVLVAPPMVITLPRATHS